MHTTNIYNHDEYNVDSTFLRSCEHRERVSSLTEEEAKDLVCSLMDMIDKIGGRLEEVRDIFEEEQFL